MSRVSVHELETVSLLRSTGIHLDEKTLWWCWTQWNFFLLLKHVALGWHLNGWPPKSKNHEDEITTVWFTRNTLCCRTTCHMIYKRFWIFILQFSYIYDRHNSPSPVVVHTVFSHKKDAFVFLTALIRTVYGGSVVNPLLTLVMCILLTTNAAGVAHVFDWSDSWEAHTILELCSRTVDYVSIIPGFTAEKLIWRNGNGPQTRQKIILKDAFLA